MSDEDEHYDDAWANDGDRCDYKALNPRIDRLRALLPVQEKVMGGVGREWSDSDIWDISIDSDDAPDGSDGGYGRHGNYVIPEAMKVIVESRIKYAALQAEVDELEMMIYLYVDGADVALEHNAIMRRVIENVQRRER